MTRDEFLRVVFEESGEDLKAAKAEAVRRLREESWLHDRFGAQFLADGVDLGMDRIWRDKRPELLTRAETSDRISVAVMDRPVEEMQTKGLRLRGLAQRYKELLDYTMPDGKRLRECTKSDLIAHVQSRRVAIETELGRLAWFKRIADLLPNNSDRVGDVLIEADVQRVLKLPKRIA
jgi:hypothetical protein